MTLIFKWNNTTSINHIELKDLLKKHDFLSISDDWEYVLIKTRNPNKKDLTIHKDNPKLRKIIKSQIPINWKRTISKEQIEVDKVKNYLKRLLENKREEYDNREKLINEWIKELKNSNLNNKEIKKAIKWLKQSINSIIQNLNS